MFKVLRECGKRGEVRFAWESVAAMRLFVGEGRIEDPTLRIADALLAWGYSWGAAMRLLLLCSVFGGTWGGRRYAAFCCSAAFR